MNKYIRLFPVLFFLASVLTANGQQTFSSFEIARAHPLVALGPKPDFFEGALIGNGGLGAVVCTRPDAVVIRFGHNNVWDIRIAEDNLEKIGTFRDAFEKISKIDPSLKSLNDDPWYREYLKLCEENYFKKYPRPFPCGSLILGFDRRKVEVISTRLDISHGLAKIRLLIGKKDSADLLIFTDMVKDRVWMKLVDEKGNPVNNCFNRIRIMPDQVTPKEFPAYTIIEGESGMGFRQVMPSLEPDKYDREKGAPGDEAFCLSLVTGQPLVKKEKINYGQMIPMAELEFGFGSDHPFWSCIDLASGPASDIKSYPEDFSKLTLNDYQNAYVSSVNAWRDYWSRSGVLLEDNFFQEIWYRNMYFFNCAVRPGVKPPGLFANWSFGDIGTAWHGDYHMDYNTQQPYWLTFSSNHLDKNITYVEEIEHISEVARITARDYYGMRGAIYPVSSYPVKMTMSPYLMPTWGWQISTTPWAVQGIWWHYLYSGDLEYLRTRGFPLIRDVVLFIIDYMTRPEAHGPQWNDQKYHIFPTVVPELYGLSPGFKFNSDGLADLTFIKLLFNSYLQSVEALKIQKQEKTNISDVKKILASFPDHPTAVSKEYGKVFVSVEGENPEMVYNVPVSMFTVFPGEEHGLHSDPETKQILDNTWKNSQNEGGNELVFQHLQAARIGMLDLEVFKREIQYNLLPNGTCALNTLQAGGRYGDHTNPYFMARMGIWFENFALPAVINECMMQSYNGIIRLFPNWPKDKDGLFRTLRAAGGFLVSSSYKEGSVQTFSVLSEKGGTLKFYNPWGSEIKFASNGKTGTVSGEIVEINTKPCELFEFHSVKTVDKPEINKLGTIALNVVETTPFVFKNKLYRLEWVRPENKYNSKGISYLHVVDHKSGKEISRFGERYRFPCAYVENDTVYVIGTFENLRWHGTLLTLFKSTDLKTWTSDTIYDAPKELHLICNTSLCKTDKGYTLMFEISGTPEAGVSFTPRFLTSKNLKTFELTPKECTFGRDRYTAPHCLRFYNGWYYCFYLEANKPKGYEQYLVRSKDLINWESSPLNPVLAASEEDKKIAGKNLTNDELLEIASSEDKNNSDIDFCEFEGKLIINYSWGNQKGKEFLAEASYNGTMGQFLEGWFPVEKGKEE